MEEVCPFAVNTKTNKDNKNNTNINMKRWHVAFPLLMTASLLVDQCSGYSPSWPSRRLSRGFPNAPTTQTTTTGAGARCRAIRDREIAFGSGEAARTSCSETPAPWSLSAMASDDVEGGGVDVDAIFKYGASIATQLSLLYGTFFALDQVVDKVGLQGNVPFAANFVLFYLLALKSRVFNPLDNNRPSTKNLEVQDDANNDEQKNVMNDERVMPTWTPPGFIFPIVWILLIGPIRAASSSMVYEAVGSYANLTIMSLMLHLSIGDVWNTINNVERRYGTSVVFILAVCSSAVFASYQYYQVNDTAGMLLSLSLLWLSFIPPALIVRTWQLNPDPVTGKREPLYPVTGTGKSTNFAWFRTTTTTAE